MKEGNDHTHLGTELCALVSITLTERRRVQARVVQSVKVSAAKGRARDMARKAARKAAEQWLARTARSGGRPRSYRQSEPDTKNWWGEADV